mgnify:CR=1 FL=1
MSLEWNQTAASTNGTVRFGQTDGDDVQGDVIKEFGASVRDNNTTQQISLHNTHFSIKCQTRANWIEQTNENSN